MSQQPLLMDVDREDDLEDEQPITSGGQTLRRSVSLRALRDSSRQREANRQQPFRRDSPALPQDDLRRKADRILRFLRYLSRDLQETKDATHMAFQTMSNIGQGFAMELERQARRIVEEEDIVGEELEQLNTALKSWMEEVRRQQEEARAKNEAANQAHHDRADIHEQVSTQLHVNMGQTTKEMRIRDEKLEAELIKTRNEFAAYTAKTQEEHQYTREEVVRIYRQRKVDGAEWGKYMAQAKERDQLLTKTIAEMGEELRKARIILRTELLKG